MRKGFLSRCVKVFREGFKKLGAFLITHCCGSKCYSIGGIPRGLIRWEELEGKGEKIDCFPATKLTLAPPVTIHSQLHWKFKDGLLLSHRPAGVITVPQGIATSLGGNLSPCGRLITTYLEVADGKPPEEHSLFRLKQGSLVPKMCHTLSPVVTLAIEWQGAFYHWLYQVLPRLKLIEMAGIRDFLLYAEDRSAFQKESLALLGFGKERLLSTQSFRAVKSPLLIIPAVPAAPSAWSCDYLRRSFLPLLPEKKEKKRIYISREDVNKRKIANDVEVEGILKEYGFVKVSLASLPFLEQIALFRSAEHIVAPHGAGLSHLVFCDSGTSILEIFSPAYVNTCYFSVSAEVGLRYHLLFGEGERYPPYYNPPIDPDIVVDPKKLRRSLEKMVI